MKALLEHHTDRLNMDEMNAEEKAQATSRAGIVVGIKNFLLDTLPLGGGARGDGVQAYINGTLDAFITYFLAMDRHTLWNVQFTEGIEEDEHVIFVILFNEV